MEPTLWVDPAPFRRHVRSLIAATGLSWRLIAAHANVAPRAVRSLLHGRHPLGTPIQRIHITTARALMSLDLDDLTTADHHRACAGEPRHLLQTLLHLGYSPPQLTRWLTDDDLKVLSNPHEVWCSAGTSARVQACHDLLTEQPTPRTSASPRRQHPTSPTDSSTTAGPTSADTHEGNVTAGAVRSGQR